MRLPSSITTCSAIPPPFPDRGTAVNSDTEYYVCDIPLQQIAEYKTGFADKVKPVFFVTKCSLSVIYAALYLFIRRMNIHCIIYKI